MGSIFLAFVLWFGLESIWHLNTLRLPWASGKPIILCVIIGGLVLAFRRWFQPHVVTGLFAACALLIIHSVGIAPLVVVGVFMFSSTLLGGAVFDLTRLGRGADGWYRLLALPLGLGTYATGTGLLVLLPVNYPALYLVLLFLPIAIWHGRAKEQLKALATDILRLNEFALDHVWPFLAISSLVAIYLCVALLPELGFDALSMHLVVPTRVAEDHRWSFDVEQHAWAVMPMNGDWLYTITYMMGGEYAARLTNLALMLTLAGLLAFAARTWATPRLAVLATLFFMSLPLTYLETTSLFIDNTLAVFLFAALICVLLFAERKEHGYLLLAAILSGVALATKLVAALFIAPLSLIVLHHLYRARATLRWRPLLFKCLIILLLLGSIPYLLAWIKTGNPVFPFYNAIFKSPFFETAVSFDNPLFHQGFHWLTLRDMTFNSGYFLEGQPGSFGWVFFVLLPVTLLAALMANARHAFALTVVSILFVALIFQSQSYLRYIYPAVPLLILMMMQGMQHLIDRHILLGRTVVVSGWILVALNLAFLPAASWYYRDIDFRALLSASAKSKHELLRAPIRHAIDYINVSEGANARVGFFAPGMVAGLKGKAFVAGWHNYKFNSAVFHIRSEAHQSRLLLRLLKENGINMIVLEEGFGSRGRFPALAPTLMSLTKLERQFGNISVRSLREDLFKNPDFNDIEGLPEPEPRTSGDAVFEALRSNSLSNSQLTMSEMHGILYPVVLNFPSLSSWEKLPIVAPNKNRRALAT